MLRMAGGSPGVKARVAGALYLLTFAAGVFTLTFGASPFVTNLFADLCFVVVALLFHAVFRPVSRGLSLLAMVSGLAGITIGILRLFDVDVVPINNLVLFGLFDVLIGYLILKSTFLPRAFGLFMVVGGLGFLTYVSPALGRSLAPYNLAPGAVAAGALSLWLVVAGVNIERWREQAVRGGNAPG